MLKFWIFIFIFGTCFAKDIPFHDCGSSGGKILNVAIIPCDDTQSPNHCFFHQGSNYSVVVSFIALENSSAANATIYAEIGCLVPLFEEDACINHNITCPITRDTKYWYVSNLFCKEDYPKVKMTLRWELLDGNKKPIFCFEIPTKIID